MNNRVPLIEDGVNKELAAERLRSLHAGSVLLTGAEPAAGAATSDSVPT